MKLTPWFKSGSRPRRAGVYRVRYWRVFLRYSDCLVTGYAYWSRRLGWRSLAGTPKEAMQRKAYALAVQMPEWQGTLEEL